MASNESVTASMGRFAVYFDGKNVTDEAEDGESGESCLVKVLWNYSDHGDGYYRHEDQALSQSTSNVGGTSNKVAIHDGILAVMASTGLFVYSRNASSGLWDQEAGLPRLHQSHFFLGGIAIHNDTVAAAGKRHWSSKNDTVIVISKNATSQAWESQSYIVSSESTNAGLDDTSGAVAIFGNTIVFGISRPIPDDVRYWEGETAGHALVFEKNEVGVNNWNETARFTSSVGTAGDLFGASVAIYNNTIVIGSSGISAAGSLSGRAHVFDRNDVGVWNETAVLSVFNAFGYDSFGTAVSIDGNFIVVGASQRNSESSFLQGAAFVYSRNPSSGAWNEEAVLMASDGSSYDYFGSSVAIVGDTIVVGAPGDDDNGKDSGSAYLFTRNVTTGEWAETAKLSASNGSSDDGFGTDVALDDTWIIIACSGRYGVYVFRV